MIRRYIARKPRGWRAAAWRRRWHDVKPLAVCLTQGAIGAVLAIIVLTACGGSGHSKSAADVQKAVWAACDTNGDDGVYLQDIRQRERGGTISTAEALDSACGMSVTKTGDGWIVQARDGERQGSLGAAMHSFGDVTGCLSDLDYEMMSKTRALDGRVESTKGRSSWTFSPDGGLSLVCKA
jgi:hypothetical protein